jgi:DNA mismatch endonuclease (patch repair protein)
MAQVKGRNTQPEVALRKALWSIGVRGWRLHRSDLPGRPDVAFGRARLAVFVDGAWWHGHPDKWWPGRSGPYWDAKIGGNQKRDLRVSADLQRLGWTVIRIWDFEVIKDPKKMAARVKRMLERAGR